MKRHNYKVSEKNFIKLMKLTRITAPVEKVLRDVLVKGQPYYNIGYNRGFIWKKINKLRILAEENGIQFYK
jgi:hypothetical protein